ncbi:MAG TPA: hypothetical protein VNV82_12020 [Bryobacteraceae bacterium]|nr:hypothetical protein [Bryobacteraceae bacterium]
MQTFKFDSILFLISEQSLNSEPCVIEQETAERRGSPLFAALQNGTIPPKYRPRLCLPITELTTPAGVHKLAAAISEHVAIRRLLRVLASTSSPPDLTRQTARDLSYRDGSVLAEHLRELERIFHQSRDEVTRHWVAWAIEHTGAADAVAVLEQIQGIETAPYPAEGIRRALANLKNVIAGAKP